MAKFKKGQSGNPGGRPKDELQLRELAREKTVAAIKTLADVMNDKKCPPAARVSAACALLDRAYGKPIQTAELTGKDGKDLIPKYDPMDAARRIAFLFASQGEA